MSGTPTNPIGDDVTKLVTNTGGTHTGRLLAYTTSAPYKWYVRKVLGVITAEEVSISSGTGAGTVTSVASGETIWSNIFSLGSLVPSTVLDVYQNDVRVAPWWSGTGNVHIDILVRVKDAGVEVDSGNLTVLARKYGTLYDHFVIDASSGRNPVPLASFVDGNNPAANETPVSGYAGITTTFHYVSKNIGNINGAQPYDCVVECNYHTILEVYEYLKYITRYGSTTPINGVEGRYYTGIGDVQFAYDNVSGTFLDGQLVTGSAGVYGYLVAIKTDGVVYMTLRNVHGTFTNNMNLTQSPSGATARVAGAVTTLTPQKQAPFGTYAGGTFFGARGIWLDHVAATDANNFQLIDSLGANQRPPVSVAITVSGLEEGDKVAIFRTVGNTEVINKLMYTSDASANVITNTAFVVSAPIESDTPASGKIRVVDRDSTTKILSEQSYAYSSWTGSTFTLSEPLTATYDGDDTVYVPFIDTTCPALATSVSTNVSFSANRYVVTRVRHKGIVPFTLKGELTASGLPVTAIRTEDTIVT